MAAGASKVLLDYFDRFDPWFKQQALLVLQNDPDATVSPVPQDSRVTPQAISYEQHDVLAG